MSQEELTTELQVNTRRIFRGMDLIGLHYVADVTVAECNNVVDASHSTLCTDPPTFMLMDGTVVTDTEACSSHAWVGVSVFVVVALAVLTPDQSRP